LKRLSAVVTCGVFQFAPFFHSAFHFVGPRTPIMTVSHRCSAVHCSPIASGITPAVLALFRSAMNSSHVAGGFEMPAFCRTDGLYQRTFARWMFTGTEYRWPLYLIWLSSDFGMTLPKPYFL